ncbi:hypothetical protein V8E54_013874 [Elaphomyces granulatus]
MESLSVFSCGLASEEAYKPTRSRRKQKMILDQAFYGTPLRQLFSAAHGLPSELLCASHASTEEDEDTSVAASEATEPTETVDKETSRRPQRGETGRGLLEQLRCCQRTTTYALSFLRLYGKSQKNIRLRKLHPPLSLDPQSLSYDYLEKKRKPVRNHHSARTNDDTMIINLDETPIPFHFDVDMTYNLQGQKTLYSMLTVVEI